MASALAAINSLAAGVGVAVLLVAVLGSGFLAAAAFGVMIVIVLMVAAVAYQLRRYAEMVATRS